MKAPKSASSWKIWISVAQFLCCAVCYVSSEFSADSLPYSSKTNTELSTPEECARICKDNESPKTCYYHFVLELYQMNGAACQNSSTATQCVPGDGVERTFFSVNRMLPGPSIQVCEGDKVVIDVVNKIPGHEVTIHWHGIHQRCTQYYDGMPFVTQCPIHQGNTFRYQWYANPGTHFWHSHSGLQKLDGLHGSLIVRQTRTKDPHGSRYDHDLPEHVIVISDWMHEPASARFPGRYTNATGGSTDQVPDKLFINGRGRYADPSEGIATNTSCTTMKVENGKSYRMRLIISMASVCPTEITIMEHKLSLIACDSKPVKPVYVDSITCASGERYDFVLSANQPKGSYWIQVRGLGECANRKIQQLAVLQYEGAPNTPSSSPPTYDAPLHQGVMLNSPLGTCNSSDPNLICLTDLKNAEAVDSGILQKEADVKIFVPFRFFFFTPEQLFVKNKYTTFLANNRGLLNAMINDITYSSPSSPLISQLKDIPPDQLCNDDNRPAYCGNRSQECACTHILQVPMNAIVEIVIIDFSGAPGLAHPFHLHGYTFHVLKLGTFPNSPPTQEQMKEVMNLDRKEMLRSQSYKPPGKDTVVVPSTGYAIIRFKADNPGYWFFHCHFMFHIAIGMNLILQVGELKDLPPVPTNFPKCGNFLPTITAPSNDC